jgi:hypothetical protein
MKDLFNIEYEEGIKINTFNLSVVFNKEQLPLKFNFVRSVNKNKIWDVELSDNSWASFPDDEIVDVIVFDKIGNLVYEKKWNVLMNGSFIYKKLWNYCLNKKNNKGVVIGTHNGEFGEWVPVASDNLSEIILIEASDKQYRELVKNYKKFDNLTFINALITTDGNTTNFYEGGKGYTNSVLKRVIEFWETEEISTTIKESMKFSSLITPDINWIHLDVEGLDDKLLYTLSDEQFNHIDLIVFEYNNLSTEERENINEFIISKGFNSYRERGVCIAYK